MNRLTSSIKIRAITTILFISVWYLFLTGNTDALKLIPVLVCFLIPGFFILDKLNGKNMPMSFENLALGFGLSFGLLTAIGAPFLIIHGRFDYFFYIATAVFTIVIGYAARDFYRRKSSDSVEEYEKIIENETLEPAECSNGDNRGMASVVFFLVIALDLFIAAVFFRGGAFTATEGIILTVAVALNTILAAWYFLTDKNNSHGVSHETHQEGIRAFLWLLIIAGITWYSYCALCNPYLDADDCTYISTALKLKSSSQMNLFEPSLGLALHQLPVFFLVMWEVFAAFISRLTSIPPVELMQYLFYPFLYLLSFSALYYFFLKIFKNKTNALLALILFMLIALKSNDYHKSLSNFFTMRLHQPKSIVNFIFVPLALGSFLEYVREKRNKNLALFLILSFATVCIHPFGLFQVCIPCAFIFIGGMGRISVSKTVKLLVPVLIVFILMIIAVYYIFPEVMDFLKFNNPGRGFKRRFEFFYLSPVKIFVLSAIPLAAVLVRDKMIRWYFIGPAILIATLFFFKTTYLVMAKISGAVTWRFIEFIIPFQLMMIWLLIEFRNRLNGLLAQKCFRHAGAAMNGFISVIAVACVLGIFLLANSSKAYPESIVRISNYSRIPLPEREVIEFIQEYRKERSLDKVSVMLPDPVSWMAPMIIDGLVTPVSRSMIVMGTYTYNKQWFMGLCIEKCHELYYQGEINEVQWESLNKMFDFHLVVDKTMADRKKPGDTYGKNRFRPVFKNRDYIVLEKRAETR